MLPIDWAKVDKESIELLIVNGVTESAALDYKEQLSVGTDEERREFLADVSSLANASGGDLVFGVSETRDIAGRPTGIPLAAVGLADVGDPDKLKLENLVRDGIAPRVSVQTQLVSGFSKGPVLVLRVRQSWSSPHMVTFKGVSRFYSRHSSGKYQLDVHEIRGAFARTEALPERIRAFRADRVDRILNAEIPGGGIHGEQAFVVHFVPYVSFDPSFSIDVHVAHRDLRVKTIGLAGAPHQYNLDGVIARNGYDYTQVFRNGTIEAVWTIGLVPEFDASAVEGFVRSALPDFRELVHALGAPPPVAVLFSVLNVGGCDLVLPRGMRGHRNTKYVADRNHLLLPPVVLETDTDDLFTALRPPFDALWQGFGFSGSLSYPPR